jgi:alkylation response protein AidB-like acyl-CoA dehydrogenase
MTLPNRYGGHERTFLERHVVLEELLAAGAPVAAHWFADRQTGQLLLRFGTEEQRMRFLPGIARGETFFSIGMSEPDSGSDLASIRTTAKRVDGGYRVSGAKIWTTAAHLNHYVMTLVRTSPASDKHDGLSQLMIDLHSDNVVVRPIKILSGEADFNEVVFNEAFVPTNMRVGGEGDGWVQVTSELAFERSGPERFLSTFPVLAETVRELGSSPNAAANAAMGTLFAKLRALRALSFDVASRLQRGESPAVEAALVKSLGTRFEQETVEVVRSVVDPQRAGARWRRLYSEAVTHGPGFTLRGGTTEILRGIVAKGLG